jgi:hypothetical protein
MTASTRAPKKYLDADRVEVNPAWLAWRKELREQALELAPEMMTHRGIDPAVYFPEAYEKEIPDDGCWIFVLEEPYTELRTRFRVPELSLWRARPHELNSGGIKLGGTARIRDGVTVRPKQAVITTPGGDLHLWPHEYQICRDPYELMSCEGAEIHEIGGEPVIDEQMLFYLQSRGIGHQDAVMLLIDQVKNNDFVYVTFPEEVTAMFAGVGQPMWRHIQRNPRR